MVTANRHRLVNAHPNYSVVTPALRRPTPVVSPRQRAVPRSRRRESQAWMTLLILASGLLLALGLLSLYGRICLTREINRRGSLNAQLKLARQREGELTLERARTDNDGVIAAQAMKFQMIRRTDREAITIP